MVSARKIDAPDIVAADGVILAKTKRDFAFSKLKEASDKCIDKKTPWCGIVEISDGKVFFVKGSFKGVDEHERTLSFMFLSTKCDDYLLALNKELQVVHQELSEETLKCINKKKRSLLKNYCRNNNSYISCNSFFNSLE